MSSSSDMAYIKKLMLVQNHSRVDTPHLQLSHIKYLELEKYRRD